MSKKKVENPKRRSLFAALGKEIGDFLRAVRQDPETPSTEEQKLETIEDQLESLDNTVKDLKEQATVDRQMHVNIHQQVESLTELIVEMQLDLKRLTPAQLSRWEAVLKRLKAILLVLAAATGGALYEALVLDNLYQPLTDQLKQLGSQLDQAIERLTSTPPRPEPLTAEPSTEPSPSSTTPQEPTLSNPDTPLPEPVPEPPRSPTVTSTTPIEPELILIPSGKFIMGSDPKKDKDARDNEQPQHTAYLSDYYIAKTPVTNAQYAAFVKATNHRQPGHWQDNQIPEGKHDHPVVNISWHDAVAYCKWLTEATGKIYRLPTEAEWEKAARGTDGRIYPWGNQWDASRCNTREGGPGATTPVGAYPQGASPYGVLDMAGNVWEWCATEAPGYEVKPYPYDVQENEWIEEYLNRTNVRVLRGGSWRNNDGSSVRCASRLLDVPVSWYDFGGCRVVSPI